MDMITDFHTSSYTVQNEACVEAGTTTLGTFAVRDSKFKFRQETSPILQFGRGEAASFLDAIRSGKYDL